MTCVGCGGTHGSVNIGIACLEKHLRSARKLLNENVGRFGREADAIPCSKGGSVEEMRNAGHKKGGRK